MKVQNLCAIGGFIVAYPFLLYVRWQDIDAGAYSTSTEPIDILSEIAKRSRNQYILHSLANNAGALDEVRKIAANRVSAGGYDAY